MALLASFACAAGTRKHCGDGALHARSLWPSLPPSPPLAPPARVQHPDLIEKQRRVYADGLRSCMGGGSAQ